MPHSSPPKSGAPTGVLVQWEDLSPTALLRRDHRAVAVLIPDGTGTLGAPSPMVRAFRRDLTEDAASRYGLTGAPYLEPSDVAGWAAQHGLEQIVTAHAPVGPVADALAQAEGACAREGISLLRQLRAYDAAAWPHATKGFFKFKEKIPSLLKGLEAQRAAEGWRGAAPIAQATQASAKGEPA